MKNAEVEVNIKFSVSKDKLKHIYKASEELLKAGISFDTGGTCGCDPIEYDWEFDWSLKGPVKVFFKKFVKDNPTNRYARKKEVT